MNAFRVAVAYSAGRDSSALLHAAVSAAAGQGGHVVALHVHHGLSANADAWAAHAEAQCRQWAGDGLPLSFVCQRLAGRPARGESVEAWAREARYRALRDMALASGTRVVVLAHHRRDQAETLLLQALRGGGLAGLSAMSRSIEREGITWVRPWLDRSRADIDRYVSEHGLAYVDDDSNGDPRFARNRLRLQVWPALVEAFPQAEASLAMAAGWAQEAAQCLAELAEQDLAVVEGPSGLRVPVWSGLGPARRSNVLRAWLKAQTGQAAPASLVSRLQAELPGRGSASWPVPGGVLRRHRGALQFSALAVEAVPRPELVRESRLCIRRAGRFKLPGWGGELVARRVKEGGIPLAWLSQLELRPRTGGEQFQAELGRPPRSLKKQYQAAGLPAWLREGPIVYSGGQLMFVPGLGVDARVIGLPGQPQLLLDWQAAPAQASTT